MVGRLIITVIIYAPLHACTSAAAALRLFIFLYKYKNPHPPKRAGALFVICGIGGQAFGCPDIVDTYGLGGSHHLATGIHTQSDVASTIGYSSRIRTLRPMLPCAPLGARSTRPAVPAAV